MFSPEPSEGVPTNIPHGFIEKFLQSLFQIFFFIFFSGNSCTVISRSFSSSQISKKILFTNFCMKFPTFVYWNLQIFFLDFFRKFPRFFFWCNFVKLICKRIFLKTVPVSSSKNKLFRFVSVSSGNFPRDS